ncbi:hypothetical protein Q0N12_04280 [Rossellomorea marisflavi]|uniref:hypothetical protein n=1 Tax=Rossellomorea marisflavi TaxID=189381 RepID=UPI00345853D2
MNFDTKYLIRWGIPGWILIMILGPFIYFNYETEIITLSKNINVLALGAFLTIIGVPLGYLLNQLHHSVTWVVIKRKKEWDEYFDDEFLLDEYFHQSDKTLRSKERYRYLLSRKHELGGVTASLFVTNLFILMAKFFLNVTSVWSSIYFLFTLVLLILIWISRNYSSRNIEVYYNKYLKKAKQDQQKN